MHFCCLTAANSWASTGSPIRHQHPRIVRGITSRTSSLRCWGRIDTPWPCRSRRSSGRRARHQSAIRCRRCGHRSGRDLLPQVPIFLPDSVGDTPLGVLDNGRLGQLIPVRIRAPSAPCGPESPPRSATRERSPSPARTHPMGGGPILIGGQVGMGGAHLLAARPAPIHMDPIEPHGRLRVGWDLGGRGRLDTCLLQRLTAPGTDRLRQTNLHGRLLGGPAGVGRTAEREPSLAGFASGPFGMVLALVFGEGSRLAMAPAVGLAELGPEGGESCS